MLKKLYEFRAAWACKSHYDRASIILSALLKYVIVSTVVFAVLSMLFARPAAAAETTTADSIAAAAMAASDPDLSGIGVLRKLFGNLVDCNI